MPVAEAYEQAKGAAAMASELLAVLPETYVAAGAVKACIERDFEEAGRMYRRAIELGPNSATARLRYGGLLISEAMLDEAIRQRSRARSIPSRRPST